MISPCEGFSWAVSGMMMPPADFASDQYARQQLDRVGADFHVLGLKF